MAKMTLDDLVAQLREAYGEALQAAVLYGSAAGGEHHAKHSDQNVLVIVKSLTLSGMRAAGAVARAWGEAGNPAPLTLAEAEWRSSVDIFAMEYADIVARHRILYAAAGYAPLEGLHVEPAHLRQQLEYEAMGTLLRLRGGIFAAGDDAAKRVALLTASASRVLVIFRALLRAVEEEPAADNEAVCRAVASRAGFDAAPFAAVVVHRRGGQALKGDAIAATLAGYHAGLERLVAYLDALPAPH